MGAQTVKEMTQADAQRLVANGSLVRQGTYAIRSLGITVTIQKGSRPGFVRVLLVRGCDC